MGCGQVLAGQRGQDGDVVEGEDPYLQAVRHRGVAEDERRGEEGGVARQPLIEDEQMRAAAAFLLRASNR
ncbi:hypothetical protein [Streptomyces sp. NPDC001508]|uniref:hypothetical protein n=1 Tax=Streptomyces sp. NPDC001508 TaxID=3154656 RepID=UPI0033289F96